MKLPCSLCIAWGLDSPWSKNLIDRQFPNYSSCCWFSQLIISQIPTFLGYPFDDPTMFFYGLNLPILVILFLTLYLAKDRKALLGYLSFLGILALLMNLQFSMTGIEETQTKILALIHLPLLLVVSLAIPTQKGTLQERMSRHIRLTGEVLLLSFLLACAVFVVTMLTFVLFEAVGVHC